MTGNKNQYDPATMFKAWLEKSGKAQADFMKNFGYLMQNQSPKEFDPMAALNEIAKQASDNQANFMDRVTSMQTKSMNKLFNMGQMIPDFLNWGAYKTTVGTNGRISIPEAERNALGLKEGDLVQVIVLPLPKKSQNREVKK